MVIAQSALPHVGQLDGALGAGIHEPVAASGMEFSRSDDLRELFHIGRLDIDNVEALVLDVEVPQVDSQIVTADERLTVAVHRDAVDVIGVCVGVRTAGDGSHYRIMVCKPWKLEIGRTPEVVTGSPRSTTASCYARWSQVMGQVVLCHNLQRLLKHLPQLYRLVVGRE